MLAYIYNSQKNSRNITTMKNGIDEQEIHLTYFVEDCSKISDVRSLDCILKEVTKILLMVF